MSAVASDTGGDASRWRTLTGLLTVLLMLLVAHDVDHVVNEGRLYELPVGFWIFLPFQYGAFLAVLVMVRRRAPNAATLAAALGATTVVGFAVSHALPFAFAPYEDPPAFSWVLVYVPMAVAAAVFAVALRLRSATGATGRPEAMRA
ncbi:MAG TPA: hypothetical protein VEK39_14305 [Solirubrobacterales bacterium]|nr:hypothetical protein [Solirubrobacterales bacterium]